MTIDELIRDREKVLNKNHEEQRKVQVGEHDYQYLVAYNQDGSQYRPQSAAGRYTRNVVSKSVKSSTAERMKEGVCRQQLRVSDFVEQRTMKPIIAQRQAHGLHTETPSLVAFSIPKAI